MRIIETETIICPHCQVPMQPLAKRGLRTGGAAGVAGMLFGGLNQLAERVLPVEPYLCPNCRLVEFYLPPGVDR